MNESIYHIYDKDNKVVAHSLSNDSLIEKILNDEIKVMEHEIVKVREESFKEASY